MTATAQRRRTPLQARRIAQHEAAHAVVAWLSGGKLHNIGIELEPEHDRGGICRYELEADERQMAFVECMTALAGPVADWVRTKRMPGGWWLGDGRGDYEHGP